MQKVPLISVIVPAFNVGRVLTETLSSVRSQTFRDFEVIINVDSGSTDDTAEVAHHFCASDPRFVTMVQPHSGISTARNTAIESAQGKLISFLDSDDIWLAEKLASQIDLLYKDARVNFTFTNFFYWDGQHDGKPHYRKHEPLPTGNPFRQLIFANVFGTSTVMVQRDILQRSGMFDPQVIACEDWDLWLRIAEDNLCVGGVREPLVRYRRWPNSHSNQRLRTAQYNIHVIEKNLRATCHPERRPLYENALTRARVELEVFQAGCLIRSLIENGNLSAVPPSVLRLWRYQPRWKWLRWYLRLIWPKFLGGDKTAQYVHKKILNRW